MTSDTQATIANRGLLGSDADPSGQTLKNRMQEDPDAVPAAKGNPAIVNAEENQDRADVIRNQAADA